MKKISIAAAGLTAIALAATPALSVDTAGGPTPRAGSSAAPVAPEIPIVLLVDLSSGQTLFSREADRRFVPASITKVMTAYTAFKLVEAGKLSLDTPVTISKELEEEWSGEGSSMFLKAGETPTIGQLLLGVTTVSANDAAVVIAITASGSLDNWIEMMNANAAELGMRDTHFGTPNGWPDEGQTYTSARDLAALAEAMTTRFPGLYQRFVGHHGMTWRNITQENHDPITGVIDGADGIKTGFTRESGYNFLGSAQRGGRRLVMVVAGAPSASLRNSTARDLMRWGFDAFESRVLLPDGASVGTARVQNGAARSVRLETEGPVLASVVPGNAREVTLTVRYRGPVEAPIEVGQKVAFLHVSVPGQAPHDVPLVAAEAVPEANLLQRFVNGIVGLVT